MGFGKSIKRAFGFSSDEDDDYEEIISKPSSDSPDASSGIPTHADSPAAQADTEGIILSMFDTVVATFNEALPSFIRDSVDPEAQKKILFSRLEKSVRDRIALIQKETSDKSDMEWQHRQISLRTELEEYKEKLRVSEEKQNEAKLAQLSSERQKRALSERVHDLESRILQMEADAEQTELEKKSLINKLKVANVRDEDGAAMRETIDSLKKQLAEAQKAAEDADAPTPAPADNSIPLAKMEGEITSLKNALALASQELSATREALDSANEELKVTYEIQAKIEKFEEVKRKQDTRINTLKKKNSDLTAAVLRYEAELADTRFELNRIKDTGSTPVEEATPHPAQTTDSSSDDPSDAEAADEDGDTIFDPAFDDTSWVAEVAGVVSEPQDFGYKPPKKKPAPPADDATQQLSLW